jgi:hypothetical protein
MLEWREEIELRREEEVDLRWEARLRRAATRGGGTVAVGASPSDDMAVRSRKEYIVVFKSCDMRRSTSGHRQCRVTWISAGQLVR